MIAIEIPAALAERPEVVPVDMCSTCGGYRCDDRGLVGRCPDCLVPLRSLVGKRVALAWRETCEPEGEPTCGPCVGEVCWKCGAGTCYDPDRPRCEHDIVDRHNGEACRDCERMVVGWTAEVEAVVPIVGRPSEAHGRPHVAVLALGLAMFAPNGTIAPDHGGRIVGVAGVDWSPGRDALVLRDVQRGAIGFPRPLSCRPFSGFAELEEVLS